MGTNPTKKKHVLQRRSNPVLGMERTRKTMITKQIVQNILQTFQPHLRLMLQNIYHDIWSIDQSLDSFISQYLSFIGCNSKTFQGSVFICSFLINCASYYFTWFCTHYSVDSTVYSLYYIVCCHKSFNGWCFIS